MGSCPSFTRRALTDCNLLVLETENLNPARLQGSAPHPSWGGGGRLGTGDPCREEVGGEQRKSCLLQTQGRPSHQHFKVLFASAPTPWPPALSRTPHFHDTALGKVVSTLPSAASARPSLVGPLCGFCQADPSLFCKRGSLLAGGHGGCLQPHGLCRLRTSLTSKPRSGCSLGPLSPQSVASSSHPGPLR